MKNDLKLLVLPLILALFVSALGINVCANDAASSATAFSDVALTVGRDETERRITWYSNVASGGMVYYAPVSEMENGAFPATAKSSAASVTP